MCPWDVLCAGEILADCWPDGREFPGGAPANVACHAAALGCSSGLVSRVGDDRRGRRLRDWLAAAGIADVAGQTDETHPTGTVLVAPTDDGPRYEISSPAAWDFLAESPAVLAAARDARVLVFGTLAQRHPCARATIRRLAAAARLAGAVTLADLNLRAPFYDDEIVLWTLRQAGVLKLNVAELSAVGALLGARSVDRETAFTGLLREFGIARGVLTAGGDGAWIFEEGVLSHEPAVPGIVVVDPVGAGDAFCAALAVGLAAGRSLRESAPQAARAAAFVVSRQGATPLLPAGL